MSALGWETFGLIAVALFLKMLFVVLVQGYVRTRNNAYVPPEDAAYFGKGAAPVTEEATLVLRAQNVLRNDGENVPIFLFLAAAYRFRLRAGPTWAAMTLSFGLTLFLSYQLDRALPALPLLALAFLLPNARLLVRSARADPPRGVA